MHILFLDESGTPSDRTFAVGGVAVPADEWSKLRAAWTYALAKHRWPIDREAKWHGVRTGGVPPALADDLFGALADAPITCFVVVLRPLAGRKQRDDLFATDEDTYATALTFLAERFQRFLADRDSHGIMVIDSRRPEVDDRMRRFFERLQREGTPYQQLDRIVDALFLGPSHYSIGLQAADLVVASALAAQGEQGDAKRWHKQLLRRFATHPATGAIEGVGLKVYPGRLGPDEPDAKLFTV
jgi:Protein of unknown function (DUF3800)